MKLYFKTLILVLLISSCATRNNTPSAEEIKGVFYQENFRNNKLIFNKGKFYFINSSSKYTKTSKCCDTISFGSWEKASKDFLALSSPEEYDTFFLNIVVKEEVKESSNTVFQINNPIEKHREKFQEKFQELNYSLLINTAGGDSHYKKIDSNIIEFNNVGDITSFELVIEPKGVIKLNNIYAKEITAFPFPYKVISKNSNFFEINIPELTYQYVALKRLNKDFIQVLNNETLFWDGKKYIKE